MPCLLFNYRKRRKKRKRKKKEKEEKEKERRKRLHEVPHHKPSPTHFPHKSPKNVLFVIIIQL
jgi:hypothetical protein